MFDFLKQSRTMKNIISILCCLSILTLSREVYPVSPSDLKQNLTWRSEKIFNQQDIFSHSRAILTDQTQQIALVLDYYPKHDCRLTEAKILLLSEQPQPHMLPVSVFGKMQIDDQLVHSLEFDVMSRAGDQFITLMIQRPDLDQILFRGQQVMFHLNNFGFMTFSLNSYQKAIREAIPACEPYIEKKSDHEKKVLLEDKKFKL